MSIQDLLVLVLEAWADLNRSVSEHRFRQPFWLYFAHGFILGTAVVLAWHLASTPVERAIVLSSVPFK